MENQAVSGTKKPLFGGRKPLFTQKELLLLTGPLLVEQLLEVTVGMADTMMVSRCGEAAISGVSLVDMINNLIIVLFAALATGGAVVVSQFLGAREQKEADASSGQLLLLSGVFGLLVGAFCFVFARPMIRLFYGAIDADVLDEDQLPDVPAMEVDEQRDVLGELEITARLMITGGEDKEEARMTRADRSLIRQCILDAAEKCVAEKRMVLTRDVRNALRTRGQDPALPEMRRVRLLEMADAMDMFCQGTDGEMFDRDGTPWPEADITLVDLATYAGMIGTDEDSFKQEIRQEAKEMAKQSLVLNEIAKQENITIDDSDKEALAKRYGYESLETMLQNDNIDQKMVDDTALMQKTLDFLVENAKITVSTEENNAALNTEAAEDEAE